MKQTKNFKQEKGITLIALVITIIVLLILAGVTINLTLGENGIFTTAQKAAQNYTQAQNQEMAGIDSFTSTVDKAVESIQNNYEIAGTVIKTENNVNYTADGAGNTIPVPVGFSPITTKEQGTKDTGFVIKNDTDGNEFVWVPVTNYQRIAWAREDWICSQSSNGEDDTGSIKIVRDDTLGDNPSYFIEKMPTNEEESVRKYSGFYIGRYEAGIKAGTLSSKTVDGTTTWTGYSGGTLVVQDNQQVWNYITRDRAVTEAEKLYNKQEDNVISKLCSSYSWDSALKFIEKKNNIYPTNSMGGNYKDATGKNGKLQDAGYHSVNNIYDMGGNVWEWTSETFSSGSASVVYRGGALNSDLLVYPAASRDCNSSTFAYSTVGFRVTIFI